MQSQHLSHFWLFEERLWGDADPPVEEGTLKHLGVWSEHPQSSPGVLWWCWPQLPKFCGCCVLVLLASHAVGCPGNHSPRISHALIYCYFENIKKFYSGIAVRCHCRAGFDPERAVEQFIIHISKYLSIPSGGWIYNWTLTVKKNLLLRNYFVTHQWQKTKSLFKGLATFLFISTFTRTGMGSQLTGLREKNKTIT